VSVEPITVELVGPEGVPLRFPSASVVERLMAFLLDLMIIGVLMVVIFLGGLLVAMGTFSLEPIALMLVGVFVVRHFYFMAFEMFWQGATPGKRLLKLKVISRDGGRLQADAIIGRNLMRDVELFVPMVALLAPEQLYGNAPWWMLLPTGLWMGVMMFLPVISKESTRVGDLVGGTLVVRVPRAELLEDQAARDSLPPGAPVSADLVFRRDQLEVYGEKELETLAGLIRKADEGKASVSDMRKIAVTIAQKLGYTGPEPQRQPERFLRVFYKQQRAFLEKRLLFGKRKASKDE